MPISRTRRPLPSSVGTSRTAWWFLLIAPKGTPETITRYIHDAAKAVIDSPAFASTMSQRGIDVDYRSGEQVRADLWREYKAHTEILRRIGMIKQ